MTRNEREAAAQRTERRASAIATARQRIASMPPTRREILSRQFETTDEQGRRAVRRAHPADS
jgi:hypothetical protein